MRIRRRETVKFELTEDEEREVQALSQQAHPESTVVDIADAHPDSWPILFAITVPASVESGFGEVAYTYARKALQLRPEDPRSKFLLVQVYQLLSLAAAHDGTDTFERVQRMRGHRGPIENPGADMAEALDVLGLSIDHVLREQQAMIRELLALKVDRETQRVLERVSNLTRLAVDMRAGKFR